MRHLRIVSTILVLAFIFVFSLQAENKYVGSKFCAACHKSGKGGTSYAVWEKTAHANAFKMLQGEEAKKIGKEKGLKSAPHEAPECLKCHVTGGGSAKNVEASFKKEEGIGCEACHGAASGFKMIHAKGDKAKNKEAGMVIPAKDEKLCITCHNEESPTFKGFKFEESWAKIAHSKPAKK
jgi:nitrate reductase cytochrome c-type subunit